MRMINLFYGLLFLSVLYRTYAVSFISMRKPRVHILRQTVYSNGFHRHFLGEFPCDSMKSCLWMCQNNDYCRTATYRGSEQQCYLYEENSYVGSISSTTDDSTVLTFDLCPSGTANPEPASICFGSERGSVPMQTVMNGLQLVKTYSGITSLGFALMPGKMWMPEMGSKSIKVYSFNDYSVVQSVATNRPFGYYDLDSQMQPAITYASQGVYLSWLNRTYGSGMEYLTPCISIAGLIVTPALNSRIFAVVNRTTGALVFCFNGTTNMNVFSYKLACVIYDQTMYIGSGNAVQQVSITPPGGTKIFSSIFNFTTTNPNFVSTDASKRLYSSCVGCTQLNNTYILTTSGTLLAQWPKTTTFAQGKASKYTYYFVASTNDGVLSFYEY